MIIIMILLTLLHWWWYSSPPSSSWSSSTCSSSSSTCSTCSSWSSTNKVKWQVNNYLARAGYTGSQCSQHGKYKLISHAKVGKLVNRASSLCIKFDVIQWRQRAWGWPTFPESFILFLIHFTCCYWIGRDEVGGLLWLTNIDKFVVTCLWRSVSGWRMIFVSD